MGEPISKQRVKLISTVLWLFQMEFARSTIGFELEGLGMSPNPDLLVMEMIHAVSSYHHLFNRLYTCDN